MNIRSSPTPSWPVSATADRAQAFAAKSLAKLETPPITPPSPWGKHDTAGTRTGQARVGRRRRENAYKHRPAFAWDIF
jgi:hypothetical protein